MKTKWLPIRDARRKFNTFEAEANKLGIARISRARLARNTVMIGLDPPDSPRINDLADQVILEKQQDGLTITLVTTFDRSEEKFTKNGKIFLLVSSPDGKDKRGELLFVWKTTRTGKFLDRVLKMLTLVNHAVENRPIDGRRRLMKLQSQVGISRLSPHIWTGKTKTGQAMPHKPFLVPILGGGKKINEINAFLLGFRQDLWYYETVRREKMGYKRRERKVRRPYTLKNKK